MEEKNQVELDASNVESVDTTEPMESPQDDNSVKKDDSTKGDKPATLDEYAYKDMSYTSEIFKLELRGLPKYYGMGQLRKFLTKKMGLKIGKVKAPAVKSKWAYVCFPSAEERDKALIALNGAAFKSCTLAAKLADPTPDPFVKRKNEEARDRDGPNKRPKVETEEEQRLFLQNNVSPLWNVPYEDQLKSKMKEAQMLINRLGVDLVKNNPGLHDWAKSQKEKNDGFICKLFDIKALPDFTEKYRNKCEFTIGRNNLTGKRTIGFRMGTYASGTIEVVPIDVVKFVPDVMKNAVRVFEKYVQDSKYDVFSPETLKGNWKQLTVRVGTRTDQLMIVVGFHPQDLSAEELKTVQEEIKDFFATGDGAQLNVNSLHFEIMKRKDKGEILHPAKLLSGEEFIQDKMCDLAFKISPRSFFQINTRCAELLIESVKQLAHIDDQTVVLDICCGIGTFGLCLAKDCQKVVGIEIVDEAVKNAKENAALNSVANCEFFCGKAEEIITSAVKRVGNSRVVGIVDPPRAGLHKNALVMLRKIDNLNSFVYLSCDCKNAFKNFTELGRAASKVMIGAPFVPVAAVPVDMFPHTNHFEFVIYFERLQSSVNCEADATNENEERLKSSSSSVKCEDDATNGDGKV